jgi:phage-related protein (TIGR01555 family)
VETVEKSSEDSARMDGVLINALTNMGTSRDRNSHTAIGAIQLLTEPELDVLYTGSWLCRRVVNLYAGEATKMGWDLALGSDSKAAKNNSDKLVAYGDRLHLRRYIREALRKSRLYGGAAIIMLVDDGTAAVEGLAKEIKWKNLRSIKGFHVLDRYRIWPAPGWGGVGEPESYQFNTEDDPALAIGGIEGHKTVTIHSSRVLRFEGEPAPTSIRATLNWWGLSALQGLWDVFKRYETGSQAASSILHDFDVWVHKIPDLARIVASGREEDVQRRFEVQALVRSVYGAILLGGEEEASVLSRSAAGISDIMQQLKTEVTGATGLPHTKLWGESPSGLGATGRSEDMSFAADVADMQDEFLQEPLRRFYEVAMKAADAPFTTPPDDWRVKFRPTFNRTEEETADLYTKAAAADSQWINAGVLKPNEVALGRFGRPEFSLDTTLIDREGDGSIKEEDFDPGSVSFGGGMAPPMAGADGQLMPNPPARPAGMAPPPRTDAADGDEPCCSACGRGEECESTCDGDSCDSPADAPQAEDQEDTDTFEKVAAAISLATAPAPAPQGRRRRTDSISLPARICVAGCTVDTRLDGTGTMVGPYGEPTAYRAVVGRDRAGAFEVLTRSGEWFLVVGHNDPATLQAAAGAGAQLRRIDSIDLAAMGISCDAYSEG